MVCLLAAIERSSPVDSVDIIVVSEFAKNVLFSAKIKILNFRKKGDLCHFLCAAEIPGCCVKRAPLCAPLAAHKTATK